MTPLPMLYPELNHGGSLAFWEDELRMDLAQERELALLEGLDPVEKIKAYKRREKTWVKITVPFKLGEERDE